MSNSQTTKQTPPTFQDSLNRTWTLNLSLDLLDTIQEATQVDLVGDDGDTAVVIQLVFNRKKLGEVLWIACHEQAKGRDIDRKAFRTGLDGDALTNGWGALVDAVVFFTPTQSREAVRAAFEKQMEGMEQGCLAIARVARSLETSEEIKKQIAKIETDMQAGLPAAFATAATRLQESLE